MEFDLHFQKHFVAHFIRDSKFACYVANDLAPESCTDQNLQAVVRITKPFVQTNRSAPGELIYQHLSDLHTRGGLPKDTYENLKSVLDNLFSVQLQNSDYLLTRFDQWMRSQNFVSRIVPAVEQVKKGNIEEGERLMKEAYLYRLPKFLDLGTEYQFDAASRVERRLSQDSNRFWTLIPEVDKRIDGLNRGELGVFQSQRSSAGKSAALAFLARSALMQGKNILLYTLEMGVPNYEDRLDQCICGLTKRELRDSEKLNKRLVWIARFGGKLHVKKFPPYKTRISDLREHAEMLESMKNFKPDLVLIDYADLLAPETSILRGDLHASGAEVYSSLLCWLDEKQMYGWTAMQSGREAAKAAVADQEHTGGSIAKVQLAHLVLSINRTEEQANAGVTRLFVVKAREDAARYEIEIRTDFARMQFYLLGEDFKTDIEPNDLNGKP